MQAITYSEYGGPEVLGLREVDEPTVGPDQVLVAVRAASVNPVDWQIASGGLDSMLEVLFPVVPGWDVAGVVESVGPAVTSLAVGEEVYGYVRKDHVRGGTYAEQVAAPERCVTRKPTSISFEEAAGLPLAGLTAYQCLEALATRAEDVVLVHGAAGGVGSLAAQIAVARGARVLGTASEANHDFLRSLGAEPVTYGEGLDERVRDLSPAGVDAVLDTQGGETLEASVALLTEGSAGRVVSIADPGVSAHGGVYVFVRPDVDHLDALAALVDDGRLVVEVAGTYPLAEAAAAWERSQEGHVRGKLVLTVG